MRYSRIPSVSDRATSGKSDEIQIVIEEGYRGSIFGRWRENYSGGIEMEGKNFEASAIDYITLL
jgi:hypothetical protein